MPDISTVQLLILRRVEPGLRVSMRMFWAPWLVLFFTLQIIVRGSYTLFPRAIGTIGLGEQDHKDRQKAVTK